MNVLRKSWIFLRLQLFEYWLIDFALLKFNFDQIDFAKVKVCLKFN